MYFRYVVSFLGCMAFVIVFMLRANLSVSIVSMAKKSKTENASNEGTCVRESPNDTWFGEIAEGEFDWDEYTQGVILGCFYYGYMLSNLFGGRIAEIFGAKKIVGLGVTVTAVLTLLTPVAARFSYKALIAVRVLEGVSEGLVYPALTTMCARWFPKSERSSQFSIINCGLSLGGVMGTLLAGILCASNIFGGWPAAFYLPGLSGFLWLFFWIVFVTEFPTGNRWISSKELDFIVTGQGVEKPTKTVSLPWLQIWKSIPFWAILVSAFFSGFSTMMLSADIPTFVGNILGFNILTNGYLSTIPPALEAVVTLLSGIASDFLLKRGLLTANKTRKLFYTIGSILPAIFIICIIPSGCNLPLTTAMLFLGKALDGISFVGPGLAILDMSPDFAGTLTGIYNCIFCTQGVIAPIVVGILTENNQTLDQWAKVFSIATALNLAGIVVFCVFGSSELQPWGMADENKTLTGTKKNESSLKDAVGGQEIYKYSKSVTSTRF